MFSFLAAALHAEREENSQTEEGSKTAERQRLQNKQLIAAVVVRSCRVGETKRDKAHASSSRRGVRVAGTQPLACTNSRRVCLFICIPAVRAMNGRVLDSLSPEDTPSFHVIEGVAVQPSLPAAD